MCDAAGVRGLAIEARHGVGIVHHCWIHHLDGAAPAHLHVFGEIDLTHSAFAELLQDVVAVRDDLTHEIARRRSGSQRLSVVGAELHVIGILGRAHGADLHNSAAPAAPAAPAASASPAAPAAPGSSTRSSLSPTMMREPCCSAMAPRAAIATPLRLWSSTRTKSASSERTVACCALIEGW